jgi:death-on-curing protein
MSSKASTEIESPLRPGASWTRTPTRCGVLVSDGGLEYLEVEDLVHLASLLLGDPPPIRDLGLLGSAAARPQTTVFGEDAYPDVWTKAAALLHSLVKNHALVDGNKRLGWLATAVFLELNATPVTEATNDDVYELVVTVAAGKDTVENIATALREIVCRKRSTEGGETDGP